MSNPTWVVLSATGWLCVISSLVLFAHAGRRWTWRVASKALPLSAVADLEPTKGEVTAALFLLGSVTLALSLLSYG